MPLFGWFLCVSSSIGGHLCSRCFNVLFISFLQIITRFDGTSPPHTPTRPRLLSNPTPTANTDCWLVVVSSFLVWPLKANAPFSLYSSTYVVWGSSNTPSNGGAPKPNGECLACNHMERLRHDMVAPLAYPAGGRAAAAHVGCCVFCVVVQAAI